MVTSVTPLTFTQKYVPNFQSIPIIHSIHLLYWHVQHLSTFFGWNHPFVRLAHHADFAMVGSRFSKQIRIDLAANGASLCPALPVENSTLTWGKRPVRKGHSKVPQMEESKDWVGNDSEMNQISMNLYTIWVFPKIGVFTPNHPF